MSVEIALIADRMTLPSFVPAFLKFTRKGTTASHEVK